MAPPSSPMKVPAGIHGNPPVIAFNVRFLSDALKTGSTLCLGDELGPGICRPPPAASA